MTVADTDVLIDFLRGAEPGAGAITLFLQRGSSLATAAVSRFELLAGARPGRQHDAVNALLAALTTLPLDAEAANRAAEVRRALEAKGNSIGMADSLIAGIVLTRGGRLLTRNHRHFDRVPDLLVTAPE